MIKFTINELYHIWYSMRELSPEEAQIKFGKVNDIKDREYNPELSITKSAKLFLYTIAVLKYRTRHPSKLNADIKTIATKIYPEINKSIKDLIRFSKHQARKYELNMVRKIESFDEEVLQLKFFLNELVKTGHAQSYEDINYNKFKKFGDVLSYFNTVKEMATIGDPIIKNIWKIFGVSDFKGGVNE